MKTITDCIIAACVGMFLGFMIMSLGACSRKTPVDNAFSGVEQATEEVRESLPSECKTAVVLAKIDVLDARREAAQVQCIAKIRSEHIKYQRAVLGLILVISANILLFFIKK